MKKFMLLLFESKETYEDFSPADMQKEIEIHNRWMEELGDHFAGGDPLEKPAKTIQGKDKVVTDGPYIESKDLISGYYLINAENLEEATELAGGCPVLRLGGKVEVREIMEFE